MPRAKKKIDQAAAIKLAQRYIEMCRQINLPVSRAILFGSQEGVQHMATQTLTFSW